VSAKAPANEPVIENRRARHDYHVEETLECGLKLTGTEVKSVRAGQISLQEGHVAAVEEPTSLTLLNVHIGEYSPAGSARQHPPIRPRALLAHTREIRKLAVSSRAKGMTLIPLKVYFVRGRAKLLIGLAKGKKQFDKREDVAKREAQREMDRAMRGRR
jgi:SsrA-binding protein